jgi:hypothetical protein
MLLTPSIILLGVGFALAADRPVNLSAFTTGNDLASYMSVCITLSLPPSVIRWRTGSPSLDAIHRVPLTFK